MIQTGNQQSNLKVKTVEVATESGTANVPAYFNASDLASFEYCQRQYYIGVVKGERTASKFAVFGRIEHDVRRVLSTHLLTIYSKGGFPDSSVLREVVRSSLDYVFKMAVETHPSLRPDIEIFRQELEYRIYAEQEQRNERLGKTVVEHHSLELDKVYEEIPWAVEVTLSSSQLGLRGRIDEVYRRAGTFVPVDIKTTPFSFVHREADSIQLGVYALLLEEKYRVPINEARIYYTRAGVHRTVETTSPLKDEVLLVRQKAEELTDHPSLPPRLKGREGAKCTSCHLRSICSSLPEEGEEMMWLKNLFSTEAGQSLALYGEVVQ